MTGRDEQQVALVEAYAKEQGLWHDPTAEPVYSETIELDLVDRRPSIAGPKRPQDRVSLSDAKAAFRERAGRLRRQTAMASKVDEGSPRRSPPATRPRSATATAPREHRTALPRTRAGTGRPTPRRSASDGRTVEIDHGHVVIAAITSCTNTSNPTVMIGAALLAKKAVERGLSASRG